MLEKTGRRATTLRVDTTAPQLVSVREGRQSRNSLELHTHLFNGSSSHVLLILQDEVEGSVFQWYDRDCSRAGVCWTVGHIGFGCSRTGVCWTVAHIGIGAAAVLVCAGQLGTYE